MTSYLNVIPGWLELTSLAFCIGFLVSRLWIFPPSTATSADPNRKVLADIWRWFAIGVGVMIICTTLNLFVRATEMSRTPALSIFPVLPTVVLRTHFGLVWITRITGEILLFLVPRILSRYRDSRIFLVFVLAVTSIIAATESASGHASDAGDFSLPEIMDWFHLLAASVWGGGLMVLSLFILGGIAGVPDPQPELIAGVASRFSRIAGFAVSLVAITAFYNGWFYVGSIEALWKSSYGLTVIVKIVLFLLLLNLGAFNRYINVPLLQERAGVSAANRGPFTRAAIRFFPRLQLEGKGYLVAVRFMRSVRIEAFLIVTALLCASLLRHEVPARHLHHLGHVGGKPMHKHDDSPTPPPSPNIHIKEESQRQYQAEMTPRERASHQHFCSPDPRSPVSMAMRVPPRKVRILTNLPLPQLK